MRNIWKNKKGFSGVELLIGLLIVSAIGAGGWVVLHAKSDNTLYKNTQFGFEFSYPKVWGTPTAKTIDGKTGKIYSVNWSVASAVFGTKDYASKTDGSVIYAAPAVTCMPKDKPSTLWIYKDVTGCAGTAILGITDKTVGQSELIAAKKFSAASKLNSIVVGMLNRKDLKDVSPGHLKDLYTDAEQQSAIDLTKSIKED